MSTILVAFDLYGTLLSTASIAKKLASHFGQEKAESTAATWRKYQLEYTWRLNSMSEDRSQWEHRVVLWADEKQNSINRFPRSRETA